MYPEEGFAVFNDVCVILRESKRTELAHEFLNYLLRPEVAAGIVMRRSHGLRERDGSGAAAGRRAGESDVVSAGEVSWREANGRSAALRRFSGCATAYGRRSSLPRERNSL